MSLNFKKAFNHIHHFSLIYTHTYPIEVQLAYSVQGAQQGDSVIHTYYF